MKRAGLIVLLLVAVSAHAGANRWTVIGPDVELEAMAVDPYDSDLLYAAGRENVARSNDRGVTWTVTPLPGLLAAYALRVAPSIPSTLYIVGIDTFHRSTDGGVTWVKRDTPKTAQFPSDVQVSANNANDLVMSARNFCFLGCSGGGVYRSDNGGGSWRGAGLSNKNVDQVALDPTNSQILYAISESKLMKTVDGGRSWTSISPDTDVNDVAVDPILPTMIYAGAQSGVFRSADGGDSWHLVRTSSFGASVAPPLHRSRQIFASATGLIVTSDQGASWISLSTSTSGLDFRGLQQIVPGRENRYYMISNLVNAPGRILEYEVRQPRRRGIRH